MLWGNDAQKKEVLIDKVSVSKTVMKSWLHKLCKDFENWRQIPASKILTKWTDCRWNHWCLWNLDFWSIWVIWINVVSHLSHWLTVHLSCVAKTLTLDSTGKLQRNVFIPAMLIGTIDYNFAPLSVTFSLAVVTRSAQNKTCWLHFLADFLTDQDEIYVILEQYKMDIFTLLFSEIWWNKGSSCCFIDCIKTLTMVCIGRMLWIIPVTLASVGIDLFQTCYDSRHHKPLQCGSGSLEDASASCLFVRDLKGLWPFLSEFLPEIC